MWRFPHFHVLPAAQPNVLPRGVTRVLNLRGKRKSPYDVPRGVEYLGLYLEGGPKARVPFWKIDRAVQFVAATAKGGVCLVHCQHGLNRTGLVVCAAAVKLAGSTTDAAMGVFATLRPPGIQREGAINTLRLWARRLPRRPVVCSVGRAKKYRGNKKNVANRCVYRPTVLHHGGASHSRQHSVLVERSQGERVLTARERVGHGHGGHVRDQVHAGSPAQEARAAQPKQEEEEVATPAQTRSFGVGGCL